MKLLFSSETRIVIIFIIIVAVCAFFFGRNENQK